MALVLTADERDDLFTSLSQKNGGDFVTRADIVAAFLVEAKSVRMEGDVKGTIDSLVQHLWPSPVSGVDGRLDREEFDALAQQWVVPSQSEATEVLDAKSRVYESELPIGRRLLAHWSVEGPMSTFVMCFVSLQIALGLYYFVHLARDPRRDVLGWGLPFAKMGAGVIYPPSPSSSSPPLDASPPSSAGRVPSANSSTGTAL